MIFSREQGNVFVDLKLFLQFLLVLEFLINLFFVFV